MLVVTEDDYLDTYKSEQHGRKYLRKYKRWFPVEATPELAALVGDLTTDGHVQGKPKLRFDFTASNKEKLESFEDRLVENFGLKGSIRQNRTNQYSVSYNYGVNSKPLTRVLIKSGVPVGNKVKTQFEIPGWIKQNRKCFRSYVERVFGNDGSAYGDNPRITLELYKEVSIAANLEDFMDSLNNRLEQYFDISGSVFKRNKTNLRKDGDRTVAVGLNIRESKSIKNFHSNFDIQEQDMKFEIKKAAGTEE